MLEDLRAGVRGEHASNLGALIAAELVAARASPPTSWIRWWWTRPTPR